MSDMPKPYDPYRSPSELPPVYASSGPQSFPGALKAICIIALILGGLGIAGALMGVAGAVIGNQVQSAFAPPPQPGAPQQMQDAMERMQKEMQVVNRKFFVPSMIVSVVHLVAASMLLAGGIMTLAQKAAGRVLLLTACVVATVFETVRAGLQIMVQREMLTIFADFATDMPQNAGEPNVEVFMRIGLWIGVAFTLMFAAIKVVFYLISVFYLRKQTTVAVFQ